MLEDGGQRKRFGVSFNFCIHASVNSLVTYKLKGLETFCLNIIKYGST